MENPFDQPVKDALKKFTVDLTARAKTGKLDPVIGRDEEVRRVIQILSRRTKNNPVLLGDPGVGKTAIIEGLAQRIISGDVPQSLKNKTLLSLDVSALIAGASFRGEFEKRLKAVLEEVERAEGQYVIFIDELHTIVGAGAGEGAVDAGNMLKPALARGLVRAIGATTLREYRQHIETDPALERRFQPILVDEPSIEDSISILRGIKEKYETHHGIQITDDALIAAVQLSTRYITERFLPDKAIDLIDEAAASAKIELDSLPASIDALKRQITRLDIEIAALRKESNSVGKLQEIQKERDALQHNYDAHVKQWKSQKEIVGQLQTTMALIETKKAELERLERDVMLNEAAVVKYQDIPALQKQLITIQKQWDSVLEKEKVLHERVTEVDIARVVARWTGIPQAKLLATDNDRVGGLEAAIQSRVVGQDEAVNKITGAIRRSRTGLADEGRPIGSFLFLGPTGVGKTETAKALASALFDDEKSLIRIDMSEYSQEHAVARLIGAPPGYVGYDEGGQLTEAIRRRPYAVILFDEVEKAHPTVFNVFLQMLDDGRLTDGKGRTVNFKNTIIIMTSNLGSDAFRVDEYDTEMRAVKVRDAVRAFFKPEFLNRLDNMVVFQSLQEKTMRKIIDIQLTKVTERLARQHIYTQVHPSIYEVLLTQGFDPVYGARPLRRVIEEQVLDRVAQLIVEGTVKEQSHIDIAARAGAIDIKIRRKN